MHLTAAPWSRSPRCSGRTRWPAPATDDPLTRAAPVALRRTGHVLAGLDRHPPCRALRFGHGRPGRARGGAAARPAPPPARGRRGRPAGRRPAPRCPPPSGLGRGGAGPLPYAPPQAVGRQAAHAPGWYRRSVIVAVLASLAVPALHGASWFT